MTTQQGHGPGSAYAEGYFSFFTGVVHEEQVRAAEGGDQSAIDTLRSIAENAASGLTGREKDIFLFRWHNGLQDAYEQLKKACREADKRGLEGNERRIFIEEIWYNS